ncbi:MAG: anaerobic carbon-monoxide dehydrogenase catalytic subunit [Armatimonadota bacterium]|nr:MAG: anaerobic carbon-monoxide dehydrogenase catalytic subunit [Armatimonadota bacterium]
MGDNEKRMRDEASQEALGAAEARGVVTALDRYESQQPQCRFGKQGICCRLCSMGPCRAITTAKGEKIGVCGATADTIVARNLLRMIAGGAAAHSDHGRDVAHTFLLMARGEAKDYGVKDEVKLRQMAAEYGVETEGRSSQEIALSLAETALAEFGQQEGELKLAARAPERRQEVWRKLKVMPRGIDREIVECMHRTHMGVDMDYRNILRHGVRTALSDGWGGSMIATDLQDVMLGSPLPIRAKVNLGVLSEEKVNIVVHGHEPILSEMIVEASREPELLKLAEERGAKGIQLSGICCTANEVLMRQGIPSAGTFLQQELAIATGAVEAMVVDVQCLMPSLPEAARCFHTELITTSPKARMPGVRHIEFDEAEGFDVAREIVRAAIEKFPERDKETVNIPKHTMDLVAGFTAEYVFRMLGGSFRPSYRPLNNGIIEGRLRGVAGVVGCCNPNMQPVDYGHVEMVKELIRNDVLVVQTGCSAIACAKEGLLAPEAAFQYAGRGLQEICEAVGIPPVLHVGSCVDNSRILAACCEMVKEGGLGEDISELPVAGAAPEWMSEKAVSIGMYVVGSGIFTVFGTPLPVEGSPAVNEYLTKGMAAELGATWAFEKDPIAAAQMMIEHMNEKRTALNLRPMMYEEREAAAAT